MPYLLLFALSLTIGCGSTTASKFSSDDSDKIAEKLRTEVEPFINSRQPDQFVIREGGKKIRFAHFRNDTSKGSVLILPGYSEYIEKYAETIYDVYNRGFDVLILDHRGMGKSSREVKNPKIVHIDRFHTYVDDVEAVIDEAKPEGPLYLMAHSTGALIGAHLVARDSSRFQKIAYLSPLWELDFGDRNAFISKLYITALSFIRSRSYAPGYSDCTPDEYPFEGNTLTSSKVRWQFTRDMLEQESSVWMCGPSTRWVLEVVRASKEQVIKGLAIKHSAPVMVFMAKEDGRIVEQRVHDFVSVAPQATLRVFQDTQHEIYREKEAHRRVLMSGIFSFFNGR